MKITGTSATPKAMPYPRIYIMPEDESLYDNFTQGRYTRPYDEFRKEGHLEAVLLDMGYDDRDLPKTTWSQKAGCKCGCSPAFIVKDKEFANDVFVTYDVTSVKAQVEVGKEVVAGRAKALYESLGLSLD